MEADYAFDLQPTWVSHTTAAIDGSVLEAVPIGVERPTLKLDVLNEAVETAGKLVSTEYRYSNAAVVSEPAHVNIFGWKQFDVGCFYDEVEFTYQGVIHLGVDLSKVEFDLDNTNRVVYVLIPYAEIIAHEVDTSSVIFNQDHNSWFAEIEPQVFVASMDAAKTTMESRMITDGDSISRANTMARSELKKILEPVSMDYELKMMTKFPED
jgi:orotate phosphoribosyltransferase-like protein